MAPLATRMRFRALQGALAEEKSTFKSEPDLEEEDVTNMATIAILVRLRKPLR
ncbi:MAG: hypothetical protein VXZ83_02080 [Verrucomicrobiota bacterium]|nr:hypothetical protein [Verrucomicrobiota bacterium]